MLKKRRGRPPGAPDLSTFSGQVGAAMRAVRQTRGLRADAVAERLGVNVNTLYKYERGKRKLSVDDLPVIADALGCGIGDLIPEGD